MSMRPPSGFGQQTIGLPGPPPRDIAALLAVLFATWVFQFFAATAVVPALLRLSPLVWQAGFVWQLATYALVGWGPPSFWFLLELFVVYWFGSDVFRALGRPRFWRVLAAGTLAASLAAMVVELVADRLGATLTLAPFELIQGQRVLLAVMITAFARLWGNATIYLFFVLPLRARLFVWLGILLGFVAYLGNKDLAGFAGICAATGATVLAVGRRSPFARLVRWWRGLLSHRAERRFRRLAKQRGLRVVRDDDDHDTIN